MSDANIYSEALNKALIELEELVSKEKALVFRKAQLKETINALGPLVYGESTDINALSLSNAVRKVFSAAGRPLSALDVRSKLVDLGFDLSKFDNPLSTIHAALKRMAEGDELTPVDDNDKKSFEATPELKPVPVPLPTIGGAEPATSKLTLLNQILAEAAKDKK